MFLSAFGLLSFGWLIFSAIYVWGHYKKTANGKRLSALSLFTACVFISVWLFLLPVNYISFGGEAGTVSEMLSGWITALMMTLLNTLQVFINDGSTDTFILAAEYASDIPAVWLRTPYTLYAALLIVAAPVFTFGNVLSLFKGFAENIRFDLSRRKHVYIMSQLNNCSVTLAKSIMSESSEGGGRLIVFMDVNDDTESELIFAAKELNAVILKRTVTELDLVHFKKPVELFLIGSDENENVTRATAITEKLNKRCSKQDMKIFAFAHSRASGRIIDSVEYGNLLNSANLSEVVSANVDFRYRCPSFHLRRVDVYRQFVWNELPKMGFFADGKDISILIVGFGTYGMEFFKGASWFCQLLGRKLEINIIDKNPDIDSVLMRYCPGLPTVNEKINPDYSVECISDVDIETDKFDRLLRDASETGARLRRTTHVIIALGSDDADTEAAIYLRELFDRVDPLETAEREKTQIFALLYDDHLSSGDSPQNRSLINHKKTPYNINFIGGLSAKYNHGVICNYDLEEKGLKLHLNWEEKESEDIQDRLLYEKFEYYRLSSMAQALYREELNEYMKAYPDDHKNDEQRLKNNEHNRWIIYMCADGYIYGERRNDRAKVHYDIVHFNDLTDSDKVKNG